MAYPFFFIQSVSFLVGDYTSCSTVASLLFIGLILNLFQLIFDWIFHRLWLISVQNLMAWSFCVIWLLYVVGQFHIGEISWDWKLTFLVLIGTQNWTQSDVTILDAMAFGQIAVPQSYSAWQNMSFLIWYFTGIRNLIRRKFGFYHGQFNLELWIRYSFALACGKCAYILSISICAKIQSLVCGDHKAKDWEMKGIQGWPLMVQFIFDQTAYSFKLIGIFCCCLLMSWIQKGIQGWQQKIQAYFHQTVCSIKLIGMKIDCRFRNRLMVLVWSTNWSRIRIGSILWQSGWDFEKVCNAKFFRFYLQLWPWHVLDSILRIRKLNWSLNWRIERLCRRFERKTDCILGIRLLIYYRIHLLLNGSSLIWVWLLVLFVRMHLTRLIDAKYLGVLFWVGVIRVEESLGLSGLARLNSLMVVVWISILGCLNSYSSISFCIVLPQAFGPWLTRCFQAQAESPLSHGR